MQRMSMCSRNYIWARGMYLRADRKCGDVHGVVTLDHLAAMVHQNQIRDANPTEVHSEGIDPEVVQAFGIASGKRCGEGEQRTGRRCTRLTASH
jgi:hypothetical protein